MSRFSRSGFDHEILNALTISVDIYKDHVSNSSFINSNVSDVSKDSKSTSPLTSFANESAHFEGTVVQKQEDDSIEFENETASQCIETINLIAALFIQRKDALEYEIQKFIYEEKLSSKEIVSGSIIRKKLKSINMVVNHISQIVDKISSIKQALQVDPGRSTLNVSPYCLGEAVRFFDSTDAIIKKLLEDCDASELSYKNFNKVIPINEMALHSNLGTVIVGLARRLDILTDFRDSLLKTEELESGIEMGVSESSKSEPPRIIVEEISTTDSGVHSPSINPDNKSFQYFV